MTEDEATRWVRERFGDGRTEQLAAFLDMVIEENDRQNLIAPSTVSSIWNRHAVDSAQLIDVAGPGDDWVDIGTGGGFPGMVVVLLTDRHVTMIEPRKRRAEFLERAVERLGISDRADVIACSIEKADVRADIISARAVASIEKLLQASAHCATPATRWVLPRGRSDAAALDSLTRDRTRMFHVEHSLTDSDSIILVVEQRP